MPTQEEYDYLRRQNTGGGGQPANAGDDWYRYNPYNPQTGQFEGLGNLPPWQIAANVQGMANLGTWQYQQRLMDQGMAAYRGGVGYMQGAQGLLQSYRPGGGATLEAGIYGQTAGLMQGLGGAYFQRAAMTQPLDYMFEYRREQQSQARMRANRQIERQNYLTAFAPLGGQVGAATVAGGYGGEGSPGQTQQSTQSQGTGSNQSTVSPGAAAAAQSLQSTGGGATSSSGALGTVTGVATSVLGAGMATDGADQNSTIGQPSGGGAADGGTSKSVQMPNGVGAGQGAAGGQQQQQQGGQQPMSGAQSGGAGAGVGAAGGGGNTFAMQGDFTPRAHAAFAAASVPPALASAGVSLLQDFVSNLIETDPFYQTFSKAIDTRWEQRMVASQ